MTAPTETATADEYAFLAPGVPRIVATFMGKGGQGKTTVALGFAARASQLLALQLAASPAELAALVMLLDVDPQASAYDTAQSMGDACPYTPRHDTDPAIIAHLRELQGPQRIYVDTPGNLERHDVIREVLDAIDFGVVPYDASPLARGPMLKTVGILEGAGVPYRVLLNNIPYSHQSGMILDHWKALDAAVFCTRCGIDEECDVCDLRRGVKAFNVFIREYAPWWRAVEARTPITEYRPGEQYAGRARSDLASVFLAVELELQTPRPR